MSVGVAVRRYGGSSGREPGAQFEYALAGSFVASRGPDCSVRLGVVFSRVLEGNLNRKLVGS